MTHKLSLKTKVLMAFVLIAFASLVSGGFSAWRSTVVAASIAQAELETELAYRLADLRKTVTEQELYLKSFVLSGERGYVPKLDAKTTEALSLIADLRAGLGALGDTRLRAAFGSATKAWETWNSRHIPGVIELMKKPETIDMARFQESNGSALADLERFGTALAAVQSLMAERVSAAAGAQSAAVSLNRSLAVAAAFVVVLLAVLAGTVTYRLMGRVLATIGAMLETDKTTSSGEPRDAFAEMASALERFRDNETRSARLFEEQEARAQEERARFEATTRLQAELKQVVAAAAEGDFSARLGAAYDDPALLELVDAVNTLVGSVDAGIEETTRVVELLAEGALTEPMTGDFKGAFAKLRDGVNTTISRLSDLVREIQGSAESMRRNSTQIAGDVEDLSRRTESQASSLEETTATMEEMVTAITSSANNAASAKEVSAQAAERAANGSEVLAETIEAMARIEGSSGKISDIVDVIDGIAFQTNLLALNAAVEAARAGEAGKGFAVVAAEVRSLAQQASSSAKDIAQLISESSQQISGGVALVRKTGAALENIARSVEDVVGIVDEITLTSREQSNGVQEISVALQEMDQLTHKNAAMVDQSARSAKVLERQTYDLAQLVAFFKVAGAAAPRAA